MSTHRVTTCLICFFLCQLLAQLLVQRVAAEPLNHIRELDPELSVLSVDPLWLRLNLYTSNLIGEQESRIDDPTYFVSKRGKYDALSEMREFIQLLFSVPPGSKDMHELQCRFPARFAYLDRKLSLTQSRGVLKLKCLELDQWKEDLDVSEVRLVFPSAYMNNPASMFGHTLLRLDSEQSKDNPLLSYGAGFSADTGGDGGFAFAAKGLLGGYRASFSVEPYYDTVKRYGDIEHRDIWEYRLNLSQVEIDSMLNVLWEIGHTYVDYYFFDENCSLYLLALLESIREDVSFLDQYFFWVIPTEALKQVASFEPLVDPTEEAKLVTKLFSGEVSYRPSLSTRVEAMGEGFSSAQIAFARRVLSGGVSLSEIDEYLPKARQPEFLAFLFEFLEFQQAKGGTDEQFARSLGREILIRQNEMEIGSPSELPLSVVPKPDSEAPELGHAPSRIQLSAGRRSSKNFIEYDFKPAYHEVLDSKKGFVSGAAIDFFRVRFRHYESDNFELDSFVPVSLESYSPWGHVFKPTSWGGRLGVKRERIVKDKNQSKQNLNIRGSLAYFAEVEVGASYSLGNALDVSLLAQTAMQLSTAYEDQKGAVGIGPVARLSFHPFESLAFVSDVTFTEFVLGEEYSRIEARQRIRIGVTENWNILFEFSRSAAFSSYVNQYILGVSRYF